MSCWRGRGKGTQVDRTYPVSLSGASVAFEDLSDNRALGVTVKTVASQTAGAISPSTPRAISGKASIKVRRAGKNLFDPGVTATLNGITKTVNADGSVVLNGTASATAIFSVPLAAPFTGPAALSAGNPVANVNVVIRLEKSDGSFFDRDLYAANASTTAFTGTAIAATIRVASGTVLSNFTLKPQSEIGSAVTGFEPFRAVDYTLTPDATLYGLFGI